jgi:cell division protein FtsQ
MIATAMAVDPRQLPVALSGPGRRALITVNHTWVLHKRLMLRLTAAGVMCLAIAGLYQGRHAVLEAMGQALDYAQSKSADLGFAVSTISISGQALTGDADILAALAISPHTSMFAFDADAARERIAKLPAIATATVRKDYPGHVVVKVTEKTPVARWRVDGVTFLVDKDGTQIANADHSFASLPLVIGDGAAANALPMILSLDRFPALETGLAALSRIGDRRWDLLYGNGVRVQLPETGVAQALRQFQVLEDKYRLLDRDITAVDLRVPGMVEITPAKDAVAALKAIAKADSKHKHTGDSEYETRSEIVGDN